MIIRTSDFTIPIPPLQFRNSGLPQIRRIQARLNKHARRPSKPTYGELMGPQDGAYVVPILSWID